MQDGSRGHCVLIDPCNNNHILSFHLEFKCTNNNVEYEALVLGLKKAIYLKGDALKVIGDSEVVTHQVRDTIQCVSSNLKKFQHELWHLNILISFMFLGL